MPVSELVLTALTNTPPTVALNTPADTASGQTTTPSLNFTGTDADSNDIRYEVQVDTSATIPNSVISGANLTSGYDSDGNTTATTASISPTANYLQLLSVASMTSISTDPNQPTVSGNSLTWVAINSKVILTGTDRFRITIFRALGASPTSGTISIDFGGQNQVGVQWSVDQFSGVDTSGTNGSGAIVQSVTGSDVTPTNTLTVTLSSFGSTKNATFGAFCAWSDQTYTQGSGFTKLVDQSQTSVYPGILTEWRSDNDTSVNFTTSDNSENAGVAIEIKSLVPLIDAVSGTDAGFSGSPDNTDPFTSAQAVTYTVQSALANSTTYYWRVRGIDPTGSNTWGTWSSTRSFTTTSGVAPTTKTLGLLGVG